MKATFKDDTMFTYDDFVVAQKKHKQHKMSWEQEDKSQRDKKRDQQFKESRRAGRQFKRGD